MVSSAPPVDGSPKKPLWRRWWVIALAVVVVLAIVGAIAGGGEDDADERDSSVGTTKTTEDEDDDGSDPPATDEDPPATDSEASSPTTSDTEATEPEATEPSEPEAPARGLSLADPAPVGEVVVVGDWAIRVAAVTPDASAEIAAENQFNEPPEPGKQFFVAALQATYLGSESATFWIDVDLKAIGASSVAYERGLDASCGSIPGEIIHLGEAFPGGTISGNVCWAIDAADAATMKLIAEPLFSFDDDDRRFLSMDPAAVPIEASTTTGAPTPQAIVGAPIGEAVEVGDWTVTVVSVTPDAAADIAAENQFNEPPAPGKQFFLASIEATYNGTSSSTFWIDVNLDAVGISAVAYDGGLFASCGVIPNNLNNAGETFPGGTISGNVCWAIDVADAGSLAMLASGTFSFDDERVAFSLTS